VTHAVVIQSVIGTRRAIDHAEIVEFTWPGPADSERARRPAPTPVKR